MTNKHAELIKVLRGGRQCDEEGAEIIMSRQACLEAADALQAESAAVPEVEKIAPVQGYTPGIPWSLHLEAYDAYCKKYGKQQALIEGWCRGGFGVGELDDFIPGWRDRVSEIGKLRANLKRLVQENSALLAAVPEVCPKCDAEQGLYCWGHGPTAPASAKPLVIDLEALSKEIAREHERAIQQRDDFLKTGTSTASHGGSHDTCFDFILRKHLTASAKPLPLWLPIESAPKDGECLLWVATDDGGEVMKLLRDAKGNWLYEGEPTYATSFYIEPTHWMPLPAAPANITKEQS